MKPTHFRRAINTTIMSKTASFELLVEMCDKVAAKTLGADLVSVQPMSAPKGTTPYTDYKYNSK